MSLVQLNDNNPCIASNLESDECTLNTTFKLYLGEHQSQVFYGGLTITGDNWNAIDILLGRPVSIDLREIGSINKNPMPCLAVPTHIFRRVRNRKLFPTLENPSKSTCQTKDPIKDNIPEEIEHKWEHKRILRKCSLNIDHRAKSFVCPDSHDNAERVSLISIRIYFPAGYMKSANELQLIHGSRKRVHLSPHDAELVAFPNSLILTVEEFSQRVVKGISGIANLTTTSSDIPVCLLPHDQILPTKNTNSEVVQTSKLMPPSNTHVTNNKLCCRLHRKRPFAGTENELKPLNPPILTPIQISHEINIEQLEPPALTKPLVENLPINKRPSLFVNPHFLILPMSCFNRINSVKRMLLEGFQSPAQSEIGWHAMVSSFSNEHLLNQPVSWYQWSGIEQFTSTLLEISNSCSLSSNVRMFFVRRQSTDCSNAIGEMFKVPKFAPARIRRTRLKGTNRLVMKLKQVIKSESNEDALPEGSKSSDNSNKTPADESRPWCKYFWSRDCRSEPNLVAFGKRVEIQKLKSGHTHAEDQEVNNANDLNSMPKEHTEAFHRPIRSCMPPQRLEVVDRDLEKAIQRSLVDNRRLVNGSSGNTPLHKPEYNGCQVNATVVKMSKKTVIPTQRPTLSQVRIGENADNILSTANTTNQFITLSNRTSDTQTGAFVIEDVDCLKKGQVLASESSNKHTIGASANKLDVKENSDLANQFTQRTGEQEENLEPNYELESVGHDKYDTKLKSETLSKPTLCKLDNDNLSFNKEEVNSSFNSIFENQNFEMCKTNVEINDDRLFAASNQNIAVNLSQSASSFSELAKELSVTSNNLRNSYKPTTPTHTWPFSDQALKNNENGLMLWEPKTMWTRRTEPLPPPESSIYCPCQPPSSTIFPSQHNSNVQTFFNHMITSQATPQACLQTPRNEILPIGILPSSNYNEIFPQSSICPEVLSQLTIPVELCAPSNSFLHFLPQSFSDGLGYEGFPNVQFLSNTMLTNFTQPQNTHPIFPFPGSFNNNIYNGTMFPSGPEIIQLPHQVPWHSTNSLF